MARLFCPWCRRQLPDGDTHCPRCGLRIAPLERRRTRDVDAALTAAAEGTAGSGTAASLAGAPLSIRTALLLGAAGGAALVGLAAVIALAVTRGQAFTVAMSNSAFFTGGVTMTLAVVLGGVRVRRVIGDVDLARRRARGERGHAVHDHVRVCVATAAALPLAVAIGLAATVH
jgi:zinc-ribbon domain